MHDLNTIRHIYAAALFLGGLVAGWVLNILAWRWPLGMRFFPPPSICPRCGTPIRPRDYIPVLGYLMLGGKCRACDSRIHPRYPIVELATAVLWGWTGWRLASLTYHPFITTCVGILTLAFIFAMILTLLVDWDTRTIPDAITHNGIIISLAAAPVLPQLHHAETADIFARHHPFLSHLFPGQQPWQHSIVVALAGLLTGLGFAMLVKTLGSMAFRQQTRRSGVPSALGNGDVKLMVFIGTFSGWRSVFAVFAIGAIMGAAVGIILKIRSGDAQGQKGWNGFRTRWESGNSVMPFGPFLAAGAVIYLFAGEYLDKVFGAGL